MDKLFINTASTDDQWISVSDMMAGLMMIFLFIAIIYIQNISKYFDAVNDLTNQICLDLEKEFDKDASRWDMAICQSGLLITFENDSNFETNSSVLSGEFKVVLSNFFPRLMGVIAKYSDSISELRIEGHTDSSFRGHNTALSGYLYNTRLSQDRSRNVMDYCLHLPQIEHNSFYLEWSYSHVTAHGMSSSKRIFKDDNTEDFNASRRVEFRLRIQAEERLIDLVSEIASSET